MGRGRGGVEESIRVSGLVRSCVRGSICVEMRSAGEIMAGVSLLACACRVDRLLASSLDTLEFLFKRMEYTIYANFQIQELWKVEMSLT
jgi:hypothetical protein